MYTASYKTLIRLVGTMVLSIAITVSALSFIYSKESPTIEAAPERRLVATYSEQYARETPGWSAFLYDNKTRDCYLLLGNWQTGNFAVTKTSLEACK